MNKTIISDNCILFRNIIAIFFTVFLTLFFYFIFNPFVGNFIQSALSINQSSYTRFSTKSIFFFPNALHFYPFFVKSRMFTNRYLYIQSEEASDGNLFF